MRIVSAMQMQGTGTTTRRDLQEAKANVDDTKKLLKVTCRKKQLHLRGHGLKFCKSNLLLLQPAALLLEFVKTELEPTQEMQIQIQRLFYYKST